MKCVTASAPRVRKELKTWVVVFARNWPTLIVGLAPSFPSDMRFYGTVLAVKGSLALCLHALDGSGLFPAPT
jgi:hypothetical protein